MPAAPYFLAQPWTLPTVLTLLVVTSSNMLAALLSGSSVPLRRFIPRSSIYKHVRVDSLLVIGDPNDSSSAVEVIMHNLGTAQSAAISWLPPEAGVAQRMQRRGDFAELDLLCAGCMADRLSPARLAWRWWAESNEDQVSVSNQHHMGA